MTNVLARVSHTGKSLYPVIWKNGYNFILTLSISGEYFLLTLSLYFSNEFRLPSYTLKVNHAKNEILAFDCQTAIEIVWNGIHVFVVSMRMSLFIVTVECQLICAYLLQEIIATAPHFIKSHVLHVM